MKWQLVVPFILSTAIDIHKSNSKKEHFLTNSRTALGPFQPPIQRVRGGGGSLGVKWPGLEADHSPSSSAEVKECVELYITLPICLHGVVLT
jgi:hypothetical protein